uniref:Uncharacterized protein n=1 Tax=Peronospora matthiolae TaxID=2874970 RepID=A0AAV1UEM4_9STRA
MVDKPRRCAIKAAESASARLCADAEAETTATDVSSVAEATQPVSLGDAGAGHEDTHVFTEFELGVSYSPDTEDGSVSTAIEFKPPAKRGMDYAMRRSIFGSSDESDEPSPKRRRSRSRDSGANSCVGSPIDTTSQRCASPSVGTSQKEQDRSVLRLDPKKRAWMPPNPSWNTCRRRRVIVIEHGCLIHQGSITLTPVRKTIALNMSTSLLLSLSIDSIVVTFGTTNLAKLVASLKSDPTGARYKLHRLSRKTGLPCLSWGGTCPCCVNNSARAPKEAYLPKIPWWRVRVSSEIYEGIDNLKSLCNRAGKTFSGSPSVAQDVPRCTAQPNPVRQLSVGSGAPKYPRTGDSRATGRGNSSGVRSHRGGSTAALLDSAGPRESPPMEVK